MVNRVLLCLHPNPFFPTPAREGRRVSRERGDREEHGDERVGEKVGLDPGEGPGVLSVGHEHKRLRKWGWLEGWTVD